jgi:hypothetical protein
MRQSVSQSVRVNQPQQLAAGRDGRYVWLFSPRPGGGGLVERGEGRAHQGVRAEGMQAQPEEGGACSGGPHGDLASYLGCAERVARRGRQASRSGRCTYLPTPKTGFCYRGFRLAAFADAATQQK